MRGKTNSVTTSGGGSGENTLKKLLDAKKNAFYLFYVYEGTSVNDLISYDDTENVTVISYMFSNCENLISIPLLNTSKVTNMYFTFNNCKNLRSIPALDVSNVTVMSNTFSSCYELTAIHMTGAKVSFDISSSIKLTTDALHEIIDNLATVTSTQTLKMGSTNLAKVSEEYKTIATNKGWTLA